MRTYSRILGSGLVALLLYASLWGAGGCGGGGGNNAGDDDASPACDGVTGGSFSDDDGGFTLEAPDGSLSECLDASPAITAGSDSSDLVGENETLVSSQAYLVVLNTFEDENAAAEETLTVSIRFDTGAVPEEDQDSLHVYANVMFTNDDGEETVLPVIGQVSDGVLTITLSGLYAQSTWAVVYNPYMEAVVDDSTDVSALVPAHAAALTDAPGYSGAWGHNTWCVMYDSNDNTVRQAANNLGYSVSGYVESRVSLPAKIAGALYANGGFREPNLFLSEPGSGGTEGRLCTDTSEPYYTILVGGSSLYNNPGGSNPFGRLFIGSSRVDDSMSEPGVGSTFVSIAHEMFHSILAGYDLSSIRVINGLNEGAATTIGMTAGESYGGGSLSASSATWSGMIVPYVRSINSTETYKVSNQLNTNNLSGSEAYSNQDFYAWVAAYANGGRLDYIATVLDNLYTFVSSLASAAGKGILAYEASTRFQHSDIYSSLSDTFTSLFSNDLRTLYSTFVVDRVYDHSASSFLRGSDPDTAGITTALFDDSAMTSVTFNPGSTSPSTGTFSNILPYSSRLLTIAAGAATSDDEPIYVNLEESNGSYTVGSGSGEIRFFVRGAATGVSISSARTAIEGWGNTNTTAYFIIVNTTGSAVDIDYRISSTLEEESEAGSATPVISNLDCPAAMAENVHETVTFDYSDADGDITALMLVEYCTWYWGVTSTVTVDAFDYSGHVVTRESGSESSGTLSFQLYLEPYSLGGWGMESGQQCTMTLAVHVDDEQGHSSNTLTCDVPVTGW